MKVVYVGDNRNRGNFGCRATSTALSQLISENNEIVGVVSGRYTNVDTSELFFYQKLRAKTYQKLGKIKYWDNIKTGLYLFIRMLKKGKNYYFSNFDFIDYDLDKSINNLIRCLPANPKLQEMDLRQYDFDALVVNGEGSFIFATPAWRECLVESMLMYWALKMGKKVYYLNGMLSKDPYTELNMTTINIVNEIFEKCEVVQVREDYSYKFANEFFSKAKIIKYPDALFTWYKYINDDFKITNGKYILGPKGAKDESFTDFDFTSDYICVSGSSAAGLASKDPSVIINKYSNLVDKLKKQIDMNVYLIEVDEGDEFLNEVAKNTNTPIVSMDTPILSAGKILANARAYISGRYHPAILASLGGTPCVFMSSNSHKTKSLQELLEYEDVYEYPVLPSDEDVNKMIENTKNIIIKGDSLRDKIKSRTKILSKEAFNISELIK